MTATRRPSRKRPPPKPPLSKNVQELVEYIVKPLAKHHEDVKVTLIEGAASILLELRLNEADVATIRGEDNGRLRAIQQVLSAAGGDRKPILDLIQSEEAAALSEE